MQLRRNRVKRRSFHILSWGQLWDSVIIFVWWWTEMMVLYCIFIQTYKWSDHTYLCVVRQTLNKWTIPVAIQSDVAQSSNIIIVVVVWIRCTVLNGKARTICKRNSVFTWYIRKDKVSTIAQRKVHFSFIPCMQQMSMFNKYGAYRNRETPGSKSFSKCPLLLPTVKDIQPEAWTCEKRRLLLWSCNRDESKVIVRGNCFEVIVFTLWRTIFFCRQKLIFRTRRLELVVVRNI